MTTSDPEVARAPFQLAEITEEATQVSAGLRTLQVKVAESPRSTLAGLIERLTTGAGTKRSACHETLVLPAPIPLQFQVQGPVPKTAVAVPVLQRPTMGAVERSMPLTLVEATPQAPLTNALIVTVLEVHPE